MHKISKNILILLIIIPLLAAGCNPQSPAPSPTSPLSKTPTLRPTPTTQPTATRPAVTESIIFFVIAGGDDGRNGIKIGCNDSAVPVEWPVEQTDQAARTALEFLLSIDEQYVGPPNFYNSLYQSELEIESFSISPERVATLYLTGQVMLGGVCDNPRFKAQIEETLKANADITTLEIYINGQSLDEFLSLQ